MLNLHRALTRGHQNLDFDIRFDLYFLPNASEDGLIFHYREKLAIRGDYYGNSRTISVVAIVAKHPRPRNGGCLVWSTSIPHTRMVCYSLVREIAKMVSRSYAPCCSIRAGMEPGYQMKLPPQLTFGGFLSMGKLTHLAKQPLSYQLTGGCLTRHNSI
jgi:hypothetical protein